MKTIRCQMAQGDVLFNPVDTIPSDLPRVNAGPRGHTMAEGEVTGHAHRIADTPDVEVYERDGTLYLKVIEEVDVTHEEHGTLTLRPGCYERKMQNEFWYDEVRQVMD